MNNELTINEVRELKQKAENEIRDILKKLREDTGVGSISIDYKESKIFDANRLGVYCIYSYKFDINLEI